MKRHSAALALGLMLFALLACNLGKRSTNLSTNQAAEADKTTSGSASSTGAAVK